ncbi:MAG: hypothetical protein ACE5NG_10840, partial [bacterium]
MAKKGKEYLSYTKKLTNVNMFIAISLAVVLTVVTYLLIGFYLQDFRVYGYFYERGPIPYVTTFFFWVAISILLFKTFRI